MAQHPKVSIVFPVYNVEPYIERALQSLLNQNYTNIEIIIVNDGSSDQSMAIAKTISGNTEKFIKFIEHSHNRGLSAARNSGLQEATGAYIYFIDSDDEIPEDAIYNLVTVALREAAEMVIGNVKEIGFNNVVLGAIQEEKQLLSSNEEVFESFAKSKLHVVAWNKLIKTDVLKTNKLYFKEGVVHEDLLWSFQVALVVKKIAICRKETYFYYSNSQSITGVKKRRNFESYDIIFDNIYSIIAKITNKRRKIIAGGYFEYQKYAVIESLKKSNLDTSSRKYFYEKMVNKRVLHFPYLLLSKQIEFKVKIKCLIMYCPYKVALVLV